MLVRGDRLPDFRAPLSSGETFVLSDDAGGLPVVIVVGAPDVEVSAPGVIIHVDELGHPALRGIRVLDDGAIAAAITQGRPGVVVAGRDHRVLASGPVGAIDRLVEVLNAPASPAVTVQRTVPLLLVDDVFEHALCEALIAHMETVELVDSPSVTYGDDETPSLRVDHREKSRLDHVVTDPTLLAEIIHRIQRRLLPEITRSLAHRPASFESPKIVRYPEGSGFFAAHRDSVAPDCAHRRLAVTINLDSSYVGGELRFPELGDETYRPLSGSAIVFSCGLLHEVTPVELGDRHAVITFLW
jgi:predicted 2-oxoglutarate/Fe(II)-dependent dioxygenase YbiX